MKNKRGTFSRLAGILAILAIFSASCQPASIVTPSTTPANRSTSTLPAPQARQQSLTSPTITSESGDEPSPSTEPIRKPADPETSPPNPIYPPVAYTIHASFDFLSQLIQIEQTITYLIQSASQLELNLINEPQRQAEDFNLFSVEVNSQPAESYEVGAGINRIPFPAQSKPGDSVDIALEYSYRLPTRSSRLGFTPYQTNFGEWYLIVPPYIDPTGWLIHPPSAVGEYINYEIGSFDIHLSLENPPPGLVLAASQQPIDVSNGYHFSTPLARSFAWSASPYYRQAEQQIGDTLLVAYFFSNHEAAGKAALQAAADALQVFTDHIGPIDLPSLAIVESLFPDGMEYHGLFFLGMEYYHEYDGTPQNYLVPIAVHETAHQWFYAVVANDQALEPWVDEVLCTYMELVFYEQHYPDLVPWWWQFRVKRFNPQGWVNSTIYEHQQFRSYVDAVYLRGALWMDQLRELVGSERFIQAVATFFSNHQYQLVEGADLLEAMHSAEIEAAGDALLNDYFQDRDQ